MRRKEKEIQDPAEILAVLEASQWLHLGMSDGDAPYVVAVNFGLRDGQIYIHSSRKGRKIETLRRNPRVCVAAEVDVALAPPTDPDKACAFGMRFRSVVGFGQAEILEEPAAVRDGLSVLMAHFSDREFTFPEEIVAKTAIIRIRLDELTGKRDLGSEGA